MSIHTDAPMDVTRIALLQPKRALQYAVAASALVPVTAGLGGILLGVDMVDPFPRVSVSTDSHYRYLSSLLLGVVRGFWMTIFHIEQQGHRFQLLAAIVALGGVGPPLVARIR